MKMIRIYFRRKTKIVLLIIIISHQLKGKEVHIKQYKIQSLVLKKQTLTNYLKKIAF